MDMATIIQTGLVGIGLIICGYYLGIKNRRLYATIVMDRFIGELLMSGSLDTKKMKEHYLKKYGVLLEFQEIKK